MRHTGIFVTFAIIALASHALASNLAYDDHFEDRTLRLDYVFAGDSARAAIYVDELAVADGWAGRRHNLSKPYLGGNGQIVVCDPATGDTIYANSFSTLFQEWRCTDEAKRLSRAFESTYLVPFPKRPVDVTVSLTDNRHQTVASLTHTVDPADILIRRLPPTQCEVRYLMQHGAAEDCVDIAIIGDGYDSDETTKFFADAQRATDAIFSHEPFRSMADRFNVVAVASVSGDSGPDVPRQGRWGRTAHRSHFDTFYSDRYLTTQALHGIYDDLAGVPAEHVILLVNTPIYGGGGIFNQITIASSDHPTFKQVLVHEFGHAYAGLADEYFYPDESDETYPVDIEPWEPNITTLVDFQSKWADMLPDSVVIPTADGSDIDVRRLDTDNPADLETLRSLTQSLGVFEGAGYKARGIYRPVQYCRMRVNEGDFFCPVCTRAIVGITDWYTK